MGAQTADVKDTVTSAVKIRSTLSFRESNASWLANLGIWEVQREAILGKWTKLVRWR